jgi:hypothetical protein
MTNTTTETESPAESTSAETEATTTSATATEQPAETNEPTPAEQAAAAAPRVPVKREPQRLYLLRTLKGDVLGASAYSHLAAMGEAVKNQAPSESPMPYAQLQWAIENEQRLPDGYQLDTVEV